MKLVAFLRRAILGFEVALADVHASWHLEGSPERWLPGESPPCSSLPQSPCT